MYPYPRQHEVDIISHPQAPQKTKRTLPSTASAGLVSKKRTKPYPSTITTPGPDVALSGAKSSSLGSNSVEEVFGEGGCVAVAFWKLGLFGDWETAIAALDAQRDIAENSNQFREDQRCDAFLGVRGSSWHRYIISRTVLHANYDYHRVNITELLQPKGKLFLVDGLSNYRFKKGTKWIYPYDLDDIEDRPWNGAQTWQHVIGIKDGKIMRNYTHADVPISSLHLSSPDAEVDNTKGFMWRIDRVYRLTPKEQTIDGGGCSTDTA